MQSEAQAKLHVNEQGVAGTFSSGVHELFVHNVYIQQLVFVTNFFFFSPCLLQLFLFAILGVASITGLSSFRSDNSRKFRNMYDCRYCDSSIWWTVYFNWAYSWIRQLQIKPDESWKHYSSRTARTTSYVKHLLPIGNFCSSDRRRGTMHNNCLHAFVLRS